MKANLATAVTIAEAFMRKHAVVKGSEETGSRPRFAGYKSPETVDQDIKAAISLIRQGKFDDAVATVRNAERALNNTSCAYLCTKVFDLVAGELDRLAEVGVPFETSKGLFEQFLAQRKSCLERRANREWIDLDAEAEGIWSIVDQAEAMLNRHHLNHFRVKWIDRLTREIAGAKRKYRMADELLEPAREALRSLEAYCESAEAKIQVAHQQKDHILSLIDEAVETQRNIEATRRLDELEREAAKAERKGAVTHQRNNSEADRLSQLVGAI